MAEEVRVRWCVGLMGAMAGRKIRRSQSNLRWEGGVLVQVTVYFFVKWYLMHIHDVDLCEMVRNMIWDLWCQFRDWNQKALIQVRKSTASSDVRRYYLFNTAVLKWLPMGYTFTQSAFLFTRSHPRSPPPPPPSTSSNHYNVFDTSGSIWLRLKPRYRVCVLSFVLCIDVSSGWLICCLSMMSVAFDSRTRARCVQSWALTRLDRRRNTDYSSTEIIVLLMLFLLTESIICRWYACCFCLRL